MQGNQGAPEHAPPSSRIESWALWVLAAAVAVRLPLLSSPLASVSAVVQNDGWRQTDTASIAHHFLANGYRLFYPQIFWGGAGPGYVETEFQLYPFLVTLLYSAFGEHLWLGRLVSLCFTVVALFVFYLLARRELGPRPALWGLAFLSFSPLYLRYSLAFMPEATVLCLYLVAIYFFTRWLDQQRRALLAWAALVTALSILVKPTSIHVGLIFAILALHRRGPGVLARWEVWAAGAVSVLPAIVWYWHARNLYLEYGNTFGILSGGDTKFGTWKMVLSLGFYREVIQLEALWVFAGVGLAAFLIGLVAAHARGKARLIVTGVAVNALYFIIVARYARAEWGVHYHIYMLPFAALGVGAGVDAILSGLRERRAVGAVLCATLLMFTVSGWLYRHLLVREPAETVSCAETVRRIVPKDSRVIIGTTAVAVDDGVQNNYQEPVIFFYSRRYGWSLPQDWQTPERIESYRRAGGRFLIMPNESLAQASPELVRYLGDRARALRARPGSHCAVYRLED